MAGYGRKAPVSVGIVTDSVACIPPEMAAGMGTETGVEHMVETVARFQPVELYVTQLTPVMGLHTGPSVLGIAFYRED